MTPITDKLAEAHRLGATGAEPTEEERLLFEAWMRGHCWALCATWNGKQYVSDAEQGGCVDPRAMNTRQLFAAWRDRAALQAADAVSAVPDGFALVREKATPLIREALRIGMRREVPCDDLCDIRWRAAIAAAKDSEQKGGV